MAELIKVKVKSSTLIEVIIAMVIILVMFGLAMGIYTNVLRTTPAVKAERVKGMTVGMLQQSVTDANWKDTDSLIDSFFLQKKVLSYKAFRSSVADVVTDSNDVVSEDGLSSVSEAQVSSAEDYADLVVITVTAFEHDREIFKTRQIVKKRKDGN